MNFNMLLFHAPTSRYTKKNFQDQIIWIPKKVPIKKNHEQTKKRSHSQETHQAQAHAGNDTDKVDKFKSLRNFFAKLKGANNNSNTHLPINSSRQLINEQSERIMTIEQIPGLDKNGVDEEDYNFAGSDHFSNEKKQTTQTIPVFRSRMNSHPSIIGGNTNREPQKELNLTNNLDHTNAVSIKQNIQKHALVVNLERVNSNNSDRAEDFGREGLDAKKIKVKGGSCFSFLNVPPKKKTDINTYASENVHNLNNNIHIAIQNLNKDPVKGGVIESSSDSEYESTPISFKVCYIPCLLLQSAFPSKKVLLYFHANNEDISSTYELLTHLHKTFMVKLLLVKENLKVQ